MSLLKKTKKPEAETREELATFSDFEAAAKAKTNAYIKENRLKHLGNYKIQKEKIDTLKDHELSEYLRSNKDQKDAQRVGSATLKINAYESAEIRLAVANSDFKSTRELFLHLIKKARLTK